MDLIYIKNMNKKGGKVLGKGRDGCVIDPAILCSTKSNKDNYSNQVSKLIDISGVPEYKIKDFVEEFISGDIFIKFDPNGENFLPGLEMCYKKYHQLNKDQKKDIKECKYNKSPYGSTYINILLKKGFSFQKTTQKLNNDGFLRSLAYILLGVKTCIHDLNILLLDVKADNLLYSEDKDGKFPVFIDFSNDFVITDQTRLIQFLNGFNQYYDTWTLEMMIFFIKMMKARNNKKGIKKIMEDIWRYRGVDLNQSANKKYMKEITNSILKKTLLSQSKSITQKKNVNEFYEKQMCYAIGKIYTTEYEQKIKKNPSFKNIKIEYILNNLITEGYHDRFIVDDALYYVYKLINLTSRKDYLIRKNRTPPQQSLSPAILTSLDNLLDNMQLTPSSMPPLYNQAAQGPPGLPSPSQRSDWVNPKNLKKKKKKNKSKSISYDLKDVTPKKLKKMKKPALIKILKKYKDRKCKKITGLKKNEIIDRILLFQPELETELEKKNLKKFSQLTLKKILNTHIETKCRKIKPGDKKKVLHDFILKNII